MRLLRSEVPSSRVSTASTVLGSDNDTTHRDEQIPQSATEAEEGPEPSRLEKQRVAESQ